MTQYLVKLVAFPCPAEINMMGGLKSAASLTSPQRRSDFTKSQRRSGSFRPDGLATTGVWTGAPSYPHLGAPPNDNQLDLSWAPSLSAGNSPPSHCWLRKSQTFQKSPKVPKKCHPTTTTRRIKKGSLPRNSPPSHCRLRKSHSPVCPPFVHPPDKSPWLSSQLTSIFKDLFLANPPEKYL